MEPLAVAVATVLGKYAIDQGATLLKEAGEAAVAVAGRLFQKVIDRLKADPTETKNADRFVKNPADYQTAVADALNEQMQSDAQFTAEVQALMHEYGQAYTSSGSSIVINGNDAFAVASNTGTIIYGRGAITTDSRNTNPVESTTGSG
jgi:hypothetical protein